MRIQPANLDDPHIIDLLTTHVLRARAETAPGSAHAIDHDGLRSPDIRIWSVWNDQDLLGIAALKRLTPSHSEIKSMHTAERARRTGIGTLLLRHLIQTAQSEGITRLSLETGSWPYFAPARSFYERHGFVPCPPFGDYLADPNSVFLSLDLSPRKALRKL